MNATVAATGVAVGLLMLWPRLFKARLWRATVTPLASIIGSGFLILGPILIDNFGSYAVIAMALLCLAGWGFGSAIRFNIGRIDGKGRDGPWTVRGETLSSWSLAFAYFISVAYYLNLLGAFSARLFSDAPEDLPRIITTLAYVVILGAGLSKGFGLLERIEQLSVSVKLAIIAALIAGLAGHALMEVETGTIRESGMKLTGFAAFQMMLGLIVTVQGFETSRYIGNHYSAAERQRSMRIAQLLSTAIYLAYIILLSMSFKSGSFPLTETAIIDLMTGVSVILGPLLIVAALAAQLSAAVADTSGAGGLLQELSGGRMGSRTGYLALAIVGLFLTWRANVFEIVSYASRAFAFYYAVQSALATARAIRADDKAMHVRLALAAAFACLVLLGLASTLLAIPAEGN
jgi:hypothetical protein